MKKALHYLIFFSTSIVLLSCKANRGIYQSRVIGPIEKVNVTSKRMQLADSLALSQQNCAEEGGCGLTHDYCGTPTCGGIILTCHTIDSNVFNGLTSNKSDGHATFSEEQILDVLNDAVCGTHWIRCYIHDGLFSTYYRIKALMSYAPTGLPYETFYSEKLLRTIYNRQINSIVLYRGTQTSSGELIVPFIVNYKDSTIGYYDVSNDLP